MTEGHILGLEEAVIAPLTAANYGCTAFCVADAEIFRLEKTSFVSKLSTQTAAWNAIHAKSISWMKRGT
mgnify:CR=1 FL=1